MHRHSGPLGAPEGQGTAQRGETVASESVLADHGHRAGLGRGLLRLALDEPRRLVLWTIVLGTVIRVATAAIYGFGNGEGYYLATARHLALSYFDQPPLSLWI